MWGKRITVAVIVLIILLVITVLAPMIEQARESARRTQSRNNLKQIGLALYNYESTYGGYPMGGVFDVERRGYHGWMALILPFIDASPFYNTINFSEPWDTKANAGLFLNNDPIYESPSESKAVGNWKFPLAHYSANPYFMAVNSFTKSDSLKNSKQMFVVGELGGDFLPWGCPYNWQVLSSLNASPPTYGRSSRDGCQFLFVDGRVEFIGNDVSADVLELIRGKDLTGFATNSLNVQHPPEFPVPPDALRITWRSFNGGGTAKVMQDRHGNVVRLFPSDKGPWRAIDADFSVISSFSHIDVLEADGDFGDAAIKLLSRLGQLSELELRSMKMTDAAVESIVVLRQLRRLRLCSHQLTDEGVQPIKKLKNLRGLELRSHQISEEGLLFTQELPELEVLTIGGSKINTEVIRRLEGRLPKCKIQWESRYADTY